MQLNQPLLSNAMTTFTLTSSELTTTAHVFFFKEVQNANELRSKLLAGDEEYQYAFIDAELVTSISQFNADKFFRS